MVKSRPRKTSAKTTSAATKGKTYAFMAQALRNQKKNTVKAISTATKKAGPSQGNRVNSASPVALSLEFMATLSSTLQRGRHFPARRGLTPAAHGTGPSETRRPSRPPGAPSHAPPFVRPRGRKQATAQARLVWCTPGFPSKLTHPPASPWRTASDGA